MVICEISVIRGYKEKITTKQIMKRRDFIKSSALAVAAIGVTPSAVAAEAAPKKKTHKPAPKPLIDSQPVLQNYAPDSQGIAFGVSALANGFVVYGRKPDLSDGKKVYCGGFRATDVNDEVMQIRLAGLLPATTYYYQIGADRIHYGGGYDMKVEETVVDSHVYSFRTAGTGAKTHFCVINDTHNDIEAMNLLLKKIASLAPSCVVWNGDACNSDETVADLKDIFFGRKTDHPDFATTIPYLLTPGNHEGRSFAGRHLERVWMNRQPEERDSRYWDLGRNYAFRIGDIAVVGLDTGEDKLDTNPHFANLFNNKPYRELQAKWLRDVLRREEIARAPYLVALCHIPLYDTDPKANPGDVAPDDKAPEYEYDYAIWQRTCFQLWGPLLDEAHCQLLITAHNHAYRLDAPDENHSWTQVVGGGHSTEPETTAFPTVTECLVENGRLIMRVHNVLSNSVIEDLALAPRV